MIKLYFFGKQRELLSQENELIRRIGFREKIEVIALEQAGVTEEKRAKEQEEQKILSKLSDQSYVVVLHERGKQYDSVQFASWMQKTRESHRDIVFVIGGAYGLGEAILERANAQISLGNMVWTRNLARYMTLEQVYRAYEINAGSNFHKA